MVITVDCCFAAKKQSALLAFNFVVGHSPYYKSLYHQNDIETDISTKEKKKRKYNCFISREKIAFRLHSGYISERLAVGLLLALMQSKCNDKRPGLI